MDAVDRVLAVLMDVEGASTQRILDAGSHAAIGNAVGLELGLTRDHFIRRGPTGPLALIGDHGTTSPGVTVLAHADAVARGTSVGVQRGHLILEATTARPAQASPSLATQMR